VLHPYPVLAIRIISPPTNNTTFALYMNPLASSSISTVKKKGLKRILDAIYINEEIACFPC